MTDIPRKLAEHYVKVLDANGMMTSNFNGHIDTESPLIYVNLKKIRTPIYFDKTSARIGGAYYYCRVLYADPDFESNLLESIKEVVDEYEIRLEAAGISQDSRNPYVVGHDGPLT